MVDSLLNTHGLASYLILFALLLASSLGFPMPEDLSLITAGVLVSSNRAEGIPMAIVCYIGILAGDVIIYRFGRLAGPKVFRWRAFRRIITARRLRWLRENLERRTFLTIFIARHLFYLRTATFLLCGAVRVKFRRFVVADMLAALITTPLMIYLGFLFAEHYQLLLEYLKQVKILTVGLGVVAAMIGVGTWIRRVRRQL